MSALIEISESFIEILEEGGARQLPTIDFVVQGLRISLREGYASFQYQVEAAFKSRIDSERKRKRLAKKFFGVNRLRIAEIVLTERVG